MNVRKIQIAVGLAAIGVLGCDAETTRSEHERPPLEIPGVGMEPGWWETPAETVVEVAPAVEFVSVAVPADVLFDTGSHTLTDTATATVDALAAEVLAADATEIGIVGHTDHIGTEHDNQSLGQRRADTIRDALTSRGVEPARIVLVGSRGEHESVCADQAESDCRALNRRVDITYTRRIELPPTPVAVDGSAAADPTSVAADPHGRG